MTHNKTLKFYLDKTVRLEWTYEQTLDFSQVKKEIMNIVRKFRLVKGHQ